MMTTQRTDAGTDLDGIERQGTDDDRGPTATAPLPRRAVSVR